MFRLLVCSLLLLAATPSDADLLAEKVVITTMINNAGHRCDRVVNIRPGASVDNGDVILIADCKDGDSHLITLKVNDTFKYYMKCGNSAAPVRCN